MAQIGPLRFRGFPGPWARLTVHIYYLVGFPHCLAVSLSWSWRDLRKDRPISQKRKSVKYAITGLVEGLDTTGPSADAPPPTVTSGAC